MLVNLLVDLWDGPDGDPIIVHGRTLTSEVMLKDVLNDAIKPYAFKTSPYPLILSLECHLSDKQSRRLAFLLKDILGGIGPFHLVVSDCLFTTMFFCVIRIELLYVTPVDDTMLTLPSPEELKQKIIIKAKKAFELSDDNYESGSESEDEDKSSSESDDLNQSKPKTNSTLSLKEQKDKFLKAMIHEVNDLPIDSESKVTPVECSEKTSEFSKPFIDDRNNQDEMDAPVTDVTARKSIND